MSDAEASTRYENHCTSTRYENHCTCSAVRERMVGVQDKGALVQKIESVA